MTSSAFVSAVECGPPVGDRRAPDTITHRLARYGKSRCTDPPLCVDLDGTLVRSDLLVEGLLSILTSRRALAALPLLLTTDRAVLKHRVAEMDQLDAATLPYNQELLDYIVEERARGRRTVLATAADSRVAHAVADHLGLFDEVICSDGIRNLKGSRKAEALTARFGRGNFAYAGNSREDVPIWSDACQALLVDTPRPVAAQVRAGAPIEREFISLDSFWRTAVRALRPHQWAKNLLVFVPLVVGHAMTDAAGWASAIVMFVAFCLTASAIYLINDLLDIRADRLHPTKRNRPLASGALRPSQAVVMAVILLSGGLALANLVHGLLVVLLYAALSLSYSVELKKWPLVDVFVLGGLYTLRVLGGGAATGQLVSMWLIAFTGFLFLALALVKRAEEIAAVARSDGARTASRRGYGPEDVGILIAFGCSASFASAVVLALFVGSEAALAQYATPELLWGIVPLLLFWQCRLWLATGRGYMHDDPIIYATRDWVSWVVAAVTVGLFAAATLDVPLASLGILER